METISGRSRLLGRDDDLAVVSTAVTAITTRSARIVLIEGEPGIGKSALLRAAVDALPPAITVLEAHARELDRDRPFGLILDAISQAAAADRSSTAIRDLLTAPGHVPSSGTEEFAVLRFRVTEAVLDVVAGLTDEAPTLLVLEDLHRADPSTLLAIGQIARRLTDRPIGVLATLRPSRHVAELEALRRELSSESVHRHHLGALPATAVDDLAHDALGASPGPGLRRLLDGAAGNPFFITELLAALSEDTALAVDDDGAIELTAPEPPASLRLTILRRLGFLSHDTLQVLGIASVLGSRFSLDDLSVVLDRPATDLLHDLDDARVAGILVDRDDGLAFRHDLVRDAIYEDLPEAVRCALHVQAARRLADTGREATTVAQHFLAGASPGDRQAIDWLERAAHEALSTAPGVAAELLGAAVTLCRSPGDRDRLEAQLATALTWSGQMDEAEDLLEDLLARPHSRDVDAVIRLALLRVLLIQGRSVAALQHCDDLEDRGGLGERQRARAWTDAATARLLGGDLEGARRDARRALDLGRELDDDPAVCGALSALSWVANLQGHTASAIAHGEQAVELAASSPLYETGRRYPHCYLAVVFMDADRLDDGLRMYDVGRRLAEAYGDTWQLPIHHWGAVLANFYSGRFEDTDATLETAFALLEEVGTGMLLVWAHALAAHVAIRRDALDVAEARLNAAEERVAAAGPGMGTDWLLWGRALLHAANGEVALAADTLRSAWELAGGLGIVSQRRLIGPDLVRLLLAADDVGSAVSAAAAMTEVADLGQTLGARAAALRCRALAEGDPDLCLEAVGLQRELPRRVEHADACDDAARLLVQAGREDEARSMLREAAKLYHDAGAVRDERRIDARLRELGVARGRREGRSRPRTGWASLTPTELEVTRLVADGLTNPEVGRRMFISPRTVETHLTHVFGKLGVASRVELAGKVARRGH